MEYVELLSIIKQNKKNFQFSILFGIFISIFLFYILPKNFISEGTIFIYPVKNTVQKQEVVSDMNFSRNIIGLSESPEFRKKYLEKIGSEVTFIPLIGFTSGLKIKEVTPNLVTISVSSSEKDNSLTKYEIIKNLLFDYSSKLNVGNATFEIKTLEDSPLSYEVNRNIFQFLFSGVSLSFFVTFLFIYFRKKKNI